MAAAVNVPLEGSARDEIVAMEFQVIIRRGLDPDVL